MKAFRFIAVLLTFSLTLGGLEAKECIKKGEADYIIVGLGTAGSVLARYLSDPVNGSFKNSVLVLEAGQNHSNDPTIFEGPVFLGQNIEELLYNPKYAITKNVPDPNFPIAGAFGSESYSNGRLWFGTSAHNFMGAFRGSSDRWDDLAAAVGNNQWTYNSLLPLFKFLETFHGVTTTPSERGFNGPLQITQFPGLPTPADPFPAAVSSVTGAPILPDYNVSLGNTAVCGGQAYSTPDFLTRSFGFDFLPLNIMSFEGEGQNGRKLQVLGGAQVIRVIFKGTKAVGVEYFLDNNTDQVYVACAKKQVILCAGVPFSAAILQRSGIGDPAVLSQPDVDIPVLVNNPLVGTGFKAHYGLLFAMSPPSVPVSFQFDSLSDGRNFFAPAGTGDNLRRYEVLWNGFIGTLPPALQALVGIDPSTPGSFGIGWYLRPESSGTAFIVDANPLTFPDLRYNLFTDGDLSNPASDLSAIVGMSRMIHAAANAAGASMIYPPESHYTAPNSNQLLVQDIGGGMAFSNITVTNHYSGTCNMGTNISNGVISGTDLHVFGTENLMVADNSIYPFPETGNTAWQAYTAGGFAARVLGASVP